MERASGHLLYCQKKRDIKYDTKDSFALFYCSTLETRYKNASPEDVAANPFMPEPYKRPEVLNFKTRMFTNVATFGKTRAYVLIPILHVLTFYATLFEFFKNINDDWWNIVLSINLAHVVLFDVPLLIFAQLCQWYGINKSLPVCSCAKIREARKKALDQIPENFKELDEDPFAQTPWIVRNSHSLLQILFTAYIVGAIILIIMALNNTIDFSVKFYFLDIVAQAIICNLFLVCYSIMILLTEKRVFTCGFPDRDCAYELEQI